MSVSPDDFSGPNLPVVAHEAVTGGRFGNLAGTTTRTEKRASIADSGEEATGIFAADAAAEGQVALFTAGARGVLQVLAASPNIAAGDRLKPDSGSAGKGVKCSAGDHAYAIALQPSTADDDIIDVLICDTLTHA